MRVNPDTLRNEIKIALRETIEDLLDLKPKVQGVPLKTNIFTIRKGSTEHSIEFKGRLIGFRAIYGGVDILTFLSKSLNAVHRLEEVHYTRVTSDISSIVIDKAKLVFKFREPINEDIVIIIQYIEV